VLQNSLVFSSEEDIDLKALEIDERQQDGYNAFDIPGEMFAKFLEINNGTLRATLDDNDFKNDAECDKRLLAILFCLPDAERALNKHEHEWYKILLDTGASVSLLNESLFILQFYTKLRPPKLRPVFGENGKICHSKIFQIKAGFGLRIYFEQKFLDSYLKKLVILSCFRGASDRGVAATFTIENCSKIFEIYSSFMLRIAF
jgi:hypothetical protein